MIAWNSFDATAVTPAVCASRRYDRVGFLCPGVPQRGDTHPGRGWALSALAGSRQLAPPLAAETGTLKPPADQKPLLQFPPVTRYRLYSGYNSLDQQQIYFTRGRPVVRRQLGPGVGKSRAWHGCPTGNCWPRKPSTERCASPVGGQRQQLEIALRSGRARPGAVAGSRRQLRRWPTARCFGTRSDVPGAPIGAEAGSPVSTPTRSGR
ncbi:MAG: hypothetical protein Ct9H300mP1_30800 [Planctomycetaceae bacterium]|nr:MAG: hypothetical protein Ct9H300mP1_30800 [Planctomycetaceae bacterium]